MKKKRFVLLFCKRRALKFLIMFKLLSFFMLVFILHVSGAAFSQQKISISQGKITIRQALNEVEQKSDFKFLYNNANVDVDRIVSINVKDADIETTLNAIFADQKFSYQLFENNVIALNVESNQQQKTVSGRVFDSSGTPLPGVTVVVQNSTIGVITDGEGNYTLKNVPVDAVLIFSFVGMRKQEVSVDSRTLINITMLEEATGIEEVVAIGYGVQKKSNVSGAITSVSSAELHSMATNNAGQALQGKVPLYVTRTSGAPGAGTSIFLRGVGTMNDSSPLWIVDGVKGAPLENFNDVESIQVLKDAASTAIYGIEAANGVILVTTKNAGKGKMLVNYDGYVKVNKALGLPKLLGTQQYADMYVARWKSNNPSLDPETNLKSFYLQTEQEISQLPSTDWVDVMFRSGTEEVHALSVSGSSDKSGYLISILHEDDKGTFENTNYSKTAIKANFSQQVTKWLKFEEFVNYKYSKDKPTMNTAGSYAEQYIWLGVFRGNPAMNVYDSTNPMGSGYGYFTDEFMSTIDWQGNNPLESIMMTDYWIKDETIWGNFKTIVTPIKGLVWTTNISGTVNNNWYSKFFYDNYGGSSLNTQVYTKNNVGKDQFTFNTKSSRQYFLSSFVDYNFSMEKHNFGIMVGAEVFESESHGAYGKVGFGIPSEDLRTTELVSSRDGYNFTDEDSGYSQFGRLTYSYDSKYLLTATFRNDASTKFAPGKRQAFFPALSIGWNLANESFFSSQHINELKLRYGIGKSGNDNVPANLWKQEYVQTSSGAWQATKVVNKDITWEKTITNNIGLDIGLLKNSFTASIDLYNKKTSDVLFMMSLPTSTGFSSYYTNKGKIQNRGVELSLGFKKMINDFYFTANGNLAYNKNKVLDLGEAAYLPGNSNYTRTYENGPVSAFYGYEADGLYQSQEEIDALNANAVAHGFDTYDGTIAPGDIKFKDLNGDGTITSDGDQKSIGNPWPKYVYGFNFYFKYKAADFSMAWQGIAGIDVFNSILQYTQNMYGDYNSTDKVFEAWSSDNMNTTIPRLGNSTHNYERSSSYLVEDGSYLRLKNVQLGYDLSKSSSLSRLKLQKFRIYLGMENALTITQFKGFDPEFMSGSNYQRGIYNLTQYPQSRSIIFGVQLGF